MTRPPPILMAQRRDSATKQPRQANPKGTAHRAHRGRARTRDTISKIGTNTVPPPDPPDKNMNPSLRIPEKTL